MVRAAPSISSHHDDEDPLDIAWTSSSESERSDTDHDRSLARAMAPGPPERRRKTLRPTAAAECSAKPPTAECSAKPPTDEGTPETASAADEDFILEPDRSIVWPIHLSVSLFVFADMKTLEKVSIY